MRSNIDDFTLPPSLHERVNCFTAKEQPEDLVGAVIFLSSEESNFITGQTIVVDGGYILH
ncbi:SDR family oxidoreductase [Chloroflexota bacterium]